MLRGILLVFFLCGTMFQGHSQGFAFYKENITFKIEGNSFYVSGIYYLRSDSGIIKPLIYPYPVDASLGDIDSVYIYNLSTNKPITPVKSDNKRTIFNVDFSSGNDLAIQISYRQMLLGTHAEYILKSTRYWKKPLEQANYQLIVTSRINIDKFSIPPQDSIFTNKEVIYYWEKYNYYPAENMSFEFARK
jgi:hypothetical protein